MQINLDAAWLLAFLLALVRAASWMFLVPPFALSKVIPPQGVVGIAAGLALLEAPHLAASPGLPTDTASFIGALGIQMFTGLALGMAVRILISSFTMAGGIMTMFGGMALPPSVSVMDTSPTPLIGNFFEQVSLLLLFTSGGVLLLVKGFMTSFDLPGLTLASSGRVMSVLGAETATFFVAALEIAAPVIAVLFVAQMIMAMIAKAAPQVNAWWLGLPFQVLLLLLLITFAIRTLPGYVEQMVLRMLTGMSSLLR